MNKTKAYRGLRFKTFNGRKTVSVKLSKNVRMQIDTRLGYRRLRVFIKRARSRRVDLYLITERSPRYHRLHANLDQAVSAVVSDIELNNRINTSLAPVATRYRRGEILREELGSAVKSKLPLDVWLKLIFPTKRGPIAYTDTFDFERDDGRDLNLAALGGKRQQTLSLWPGMRVLLEDLGRFARLSVYSRQSDGCVDQHVLATSLEPHLARATKRLDIAIARYREEINAMPESLAQRMPVDQWLQVLQQCNPAGPGTETTGDSLLTVPAIKGREAVNSLARWVITPSVMLAFWERADRPALYLLTRPEPGSKRMEQIRISSVPVPSVSEVRRLLIEAVMSDLEDVSPYKGYLEQALIDTDAMRCRPVSMEEATCAVNDLPLKAMVTFYDQAILPTRLNGHRQRLYPDADESLRWISHAGPESMTAVQDCWWVLVGKQSDALGKLFPWGDDPNAALDQAKRWRDQHG